MEMYEMKTMNAVTKGNQPWIDQKENIIETVIFEEDITVIPNESIKGFSSMKTINIASTVKEITSVIVFNKYESLEAIKVKTSEWYKTENSVLIYNKNETLKKYPIAKTQHEPIPNDIKNHWRKIIWIK